MDNWYKLYKISFRNRLWSITRSMGIEIFKKINKMTKEKLTTSIVNFPEYVINQFTKNKLYPQSVYINIDAPVPDIKVDAKYKYNKNNQFLSIIISINKEFMFKNLSNLSEMLSNKIRHELEHDLQDTKLQLPEENISDEQKRNSNDIKISIPEWEKYLSHTTEIDAHIQGLMIIAKKTKQPVEKLIFNTIRDKLFGQFYNEVLIEINNGTENGKKYLEMFRKINYAYLRRLKELFPNRIRANKDTDKIFMK